MFEQQAEGSLREAAADVLETMFFVGAEPVSAPNVPAHVLASVHFTGTHSGDLTVFMEDCAAQTVAANFLGLDESDQIPAGRVGEVVCELTNMLCGALLSRWNPNGEYSLESPELGREHEGPSAAACQFDTGAGVLGVSLSVVS